MNQVNSRGRKDWKKLQLAEWRKKERGEARDRGRKGKREKEGGEGRAGEGLLLLQ